MEWDQFWSSTDKHASGFPVAITNLHYGVMAEVSNIFRTRNKIVE